MSVRQNSLNNPMPWTISGGPIAFGGFLHRIKERYRFWGVQPKRSHGYVLDRGIAFGGVLSHLKLFCAIPRA